MKKIMMFILIVVYLVPNTVFAETYYTDYGSWQETQQQVENNELQEGKIEYQYKFYKLDKKYSDKYYRVGENPKNYPYQSDKKQKTKFSLWQKNKPDEILNREIETKEVYRYQELEKVSSVTIYDVDGSDDRLGLTEIEVLYQNEKIPITLECTDCDRKLIENLTNNLSYEQASFLYPNQELIIRLDKEYNPKDLQLNVYVSDTVRNKPVIFHIKTLSKIKQPYILKKRAYWTISSIGGSYKDEIKIKDAIIDKKWDETIIESDEKVEENTWINILDPVKYYRYRDTEYLYYQLVPNYLDGFYFDYPNYICDQTQKKPIFYKRTRDKIEVKDNIVLTKNYLDIDDIIASSTIKEKDLSIRNNIDWLKSGIYQVTISYGALQITVPVTLSIVEQQTEQVASETIKEESKPALKKVSISKKEEPKKQKKELIKPSNIFLLILFFLGLFLVLYSLEKIVDRKK